MPEESRPTVLHIRDRGRRRDEYEVMVDGRHVGTVMVPDQVIHSYPSEASLRRAVDRSVADVSRAPGGGCKLWLTTWFPGMGVT